MIPVDFVLRANTAAFTRAVAGAEGRLQGLKKSLASFGGGNLAGAIGITGLIAGFTGALKSAQAMRAELEAAGRPVDDLTRGAAELGDWFDSAAGAVKRFAVAAVGALTEVGATARRAMQGVSKEEEEAARRMAQESGKAALEAEARLAEARRANSPEKIAEAERKLADIRRDNAMKASDAEGKLVLLLARKLELEKERDALGAKTVARLEKEGEILKLNADIEAQRAEVSKEEKARDDQIRELGRQTWEIDAEQKEIMREEAKARADRILPSIEDLAGRAAQNREARANYGIGSDGSLVSELDPNDPALRAERALQLEEKARAAALSADPVDRLQMAPQFQAEAEALRQSLAGTVQSRDSDVGAQFKDALKDTNDRLDEVVEKLGGLLKSQ